MDDINHVYDFAVKWIEKFKDPNTNAMELTDHYMADDCKELGFERFPEISIRVLDTV